MKELQDNTNSVALVDAEENDTSKIKFSELLKLCLHRWYWFVISIVICVGLGILKIKKTTPVYERTALIQIRDDDQGSSINSTLANTFADLGVSSASSNINNELLAILSPRLLSEVIEKLDLTVSATTKEDGMRKLPVYGKQLPYQVTEAEPFGQTVYFTMKATAGAEEGTLSNFEINVSGKKEQRDWSYTFNTNSIDTIETPAGNIIIKPAANYTGERLPAVNLNFTCANPDATLKSLQSRIKSSLADKDATVIKLSITDTSIDRADDILNTLIEVYRQSWIEDRNMMARETSLFINDRLIDLEAELSNVDTDISSFKSKNRIPDVDAASQLYLQTASRTTEQIQALRSQLDNARYLRNFISNPANINQFLPANSAFPGMSQQLSDYNKLVTERNSLVASSSEKNPRVITYDIQISEMKDAIIAAIDNEIVGIQNSIKAFEQSEAGVNERLAANPGQAKYLLSVERQQKVKESLYLFLLQKREENELSQAFAPYNSRVLQYASGSSSPKSPRTAIILAMSFIVGLILPTGVIYVSELMNTKVRSSLDVESLSIPYLGEIPQVGHRRKLWRRIFSKKHVDKDQGILVRHGQNNVVNEAFRMLRSNLEFMTRSDKGNCKVVMVTSAIPGSGKTFISENLATALSLKDTKTLLIDLDMRRHTLSNQLAEHNRAGASNYLASRVDDINSLVAHGIDGFDNLDFIAAGPVPPNPVELLSTSRLKELIDFGRKNYDMVIIDCPPSEAVADTRSLADICDMTVYVVRVGNLERSFLPVIERMNKDNRFPRMAIVVNGAEITGVHSYGYRYGYGYGYRYGYGYGYGNTKSKKTGNS